MGKIIDFKSGKEVTIQSNEEDVYEYDLQDVFNSQVLTYMNALIHTMEMDEYIKQQFVELVSNANTTLENIIAHKNGLL